MATKRQRASGSWEYTIKRSKLLPKPLSLTFQTEEEGDAYVARLEQLLDAGIVPTEVAAQLEEIVTVEDALRAYMRRVSLPGSDRALLDTMFGRLDVVKKPLTAVGYLSYASRA